MRNTRRSINNEQRPEYPDICDTTYCYPGQYSPSPLPENDRHGRASQDSKATRNESRIGIIKARRCWPETLSSRSKKRLRQKNSEQGRHRYPDAEYNNVDDDSIHLFRTEACSSWDHHHGWSPEVRGS